MPLRRSRELRIQQRILIPVVACLLVLSGCRSAKTFDVTVRPEPRTMRPQEVSAVAAGNQVARALAFAVAAGNNAKEQPTPSPREPSSVVVALPPTTTVPAATSINWDCIATAETGGNWTMHGSQYSSALGVMNRAVRENAPADVAARILSGTASRQEQIDMAQNIVNRFGINAWAPSTVAKCT